MKHVRRETSEGLLPHRVMVRADNAIHQGVPQEPLSEVAPRGLHFSVRFMKAAAEGKDQRIKYRGIALDGDSVEFIEDVPDGGRDIQDAPVYWTLPGGVTVYKLVRELIELSNDELKEGLGPEVYGAVAKELNYWCLGDVEDAVLEEFKADPSTLGGGEWQQLKASPRTESHIMSQLGFHFGYRAAPGTMERHNAERHSQRFQIEV